jgi:MFS family permease
MLAKYRLAFSDNSARRFSTAGFIARMPMAMVGIGILMYVETERGSYTIAGALSGSVSLAAAIGTPFTSRLADKFGQHRVLPIQISIILISSTSLILLIPTEVPSPYLFIFSITSGLSNPAIGALVRARWTSLIKTGPILLTAFSIESLIDELIFIIGPSVAAVTSVQIHPAAPQIIAIVLLVSGGFWLSSMRGSEPIIYSHQRKRGRPAIFENGLIYIWLIHVSIGIFFGAVETSIIAFTKISGLPIFGGIIMAIWAFGSLLGGFVFGGIELKSTLSKQLIIISFLIIPPTLALVFVSNITWLVILSAVAGIGVAPLLIAGASITQQRCADGRTTEAFASMYSGIGVGFAAAVAISGWLIDNRGTNYAFALGLIAAIITFLCTILSQRKFKSLTKNS